MVLLEVKKSAWKEIDFVSILLCLLIIPIIVLVVKIMAVKKERILFYEDKIVVEKGLISKSRKQFAFAGVFSVNVYQSLLGRICDYGTVSIDFVGKNDINTEYIKEPEKLAKFLETRIVKKTDITTHMF